MINDGLHGCTYDADGNILSVDSGSTATYLYNALNQRVRTTVGSVITDFTFNAAGQRVSTWNGTTGAQIQGQYYWGANPVAFYKSGATHFQHEDWLGTERLRTTYNGAVEGTYTSLPFGDAQTIASGTDLDQYHYAQLDYDSETTTSHAQFRQYNSTQGRWMRPDPYTGSYDPSNPQSFNRYAYLLNNPLSAVDPSGLDGECANVRTGDGVHPMDNSGCGTPCIDTASNVCVYSGDPPSYPCNDSCPTGAPPSPGSAPRAGPNNAKQQLQQCVSNFYNSKLGQAVQFGSPLSLLPGWNQQWGNNLQEWGVAIGGKLGGLLTLPPQNVSLSELF